VVVRPCRRSRADGSSVRAPPGATRNGARARPLRPRASVSNDGIVRGSSLRAAFPATSAVMLPLRIFVLSLRKTVDAKPFLFAEFRRRPPAEIPEILEAELNTWLERMFLQFREMELRLLLSSLRGTHKEPPPQQPFDEARPPLA
jgi:hypothetical protein